MILLVLFKKKKFPARMDFTTFCAQLNVKVQSEKKQSPSPCFPPIEVLEAHLKGQFNAAFGKIDGKSNWNRVGLELLEHIYFEFKPPGQEENDDFNDSDEEGIYLFRHNIFIK